MKVYGQEWRAKRAARIMRSMWPQHRYEVQPASWWQFGFASGFVVVCKHEDGREMPCGELEALPFTVTASGEPIVFQVAYPGADRRYAYGGFAWRTHRQAKNMCFRLTQPAFTCPAEYFGPFQPHIRRRIRAEAREIA